MSAVKIRYVPKPKEEPVQLGSILVGQWFRTVSGDVGMKVGGERGERGTLWVRCRDAQIVDGFADARVFLIDAELVIHGEKP